jgi:hypothetical protein
MSLLNQQNFLARLYTDENLRRSFLSEPAKIGRQNDLSESEIAELAAIIPAELNFFAESLYWKRLREVEKFLPLTKKAMAGDFEKYFREFANQFLPKTIKKHLEDAIEFCAFLQNSGISWKKDLSKFEQARLIFNSNTKNFVCKKFDFDIREILKELSCESPSTRSNFPKRKTFAVWFRIGKKVKHFIR